MAPAGVLAVVQALTNVENVVAQRERLIAAGLQNSAEDERVAFLEIRKDMRDAVRELRALTDFTEACVTALSDVTKDDPRFVHAVIFSSTGTSTCATQEQPEIGGNWAWRDFVNQPRFMLGAPRAAEGETPILLALYPMPSPTDDAVALGLWIDLTLIRSIAASDMADRPFALLGRHGEIIARNPAAVGEWLPPEKEDLLSGVKRVVNARAVDGERRKFFVEPLITGQLWAVIASPVVSVGEILLGPQGLGVVTPVLLWLIAVIVAGVAIDRLVTRHVIYLQRVAGRLGRGQLDTQIQRLEGAPSEIERLGDAVRDMARNLSQRETALQEMVAVQKSLLLEVHHRVKNNLQMISSLMNMQLRRSGSRHREAVDADGAGSHPWARAGPPAPLRYGTLGFGGAGRVAAGSV